MEEFQRIKNSLPKRPSCKADEQRLGANTDSKEAKTSQGSKMQGGISQSYFLGEDQDKENKKNLSNLVVDSSSGAIKYRSSILTEAARLKALPNKSTPKITAGVNVVPIKGKRTGENGVLAQKKTEETTRIQKDAGKQATPTAILGRSNIRTGNTTNETTTPTTTKKPFERRSPGNPFSILEHGHYTSSFYTRDQRNMKDGDPYKSSKNKSFNSSNRSNTEQVSGELSSKKDLLQIKTPNNKADPNRKSLSLSASKRNKFTSASKNLGNSALDAKEVNLYETGSQTQVNRFTPTLEDSTKKVAYLSKQSGYLLDSLKKVVIDDSGLKRKKSQLKIDDLQEMFEDDKRFIESTKKIKEQIESSSKKNKNERLVQYEPFDGKKLNFNEGSDQVEFASVASKIQKNLEDNLEYDEAKSNIQKTISFEKLKSQKRPLKSVDFVSIKNNLRLKKLVSGEGQRFASPKNRELQDKSSPGTNSTVKIDTLFTHHSMKKLKQIDNLDFRQKFTGLEEEGEEDTNFFNKTSDAKFTFSETIKNLAHLQEEKPETSEVCQKMSLRKKILSGISKPLKIDLVESRLSPFRHPSFQSFAVKMDSYLASLAQHVKGKLPLPCFTLEDYFKLILANEEILEKQGSGVLNLLKPHIFSNVMKIQVWSISLYFKYFVGKPNHGGLQIQSLACDLIEKVLKVFKLLVKTTTNQIQNEVTDFFSQDDLSDMIEFSTDRILELLFKL